ncbi:MAG TPA: glycosyltransferase family 4 protein [Isosphaeraceae bacterium]
MKILMIGHSLTVALNRRLSVEIARAAGDSARLTVVAPTFVWGDLRPIRLEPLPDEPFELIPIPMRLTKKLHVAFYVPGPLRDIMRRDRWDVVHAWEEPYILPGFQIARAAPRDAKLVYSTYQNISKRYVPPFGRMERYALRRASGWVTGGTTGLQALGDRPGYRDRPWRMIPLGVDCEVFHPDPDAGRRVRADLGWDDPGPPIVGYLGRFVPEKGVELLPKALDALPEGSWRALFVGGGPMESALREWGERYPGRVKVVTGVAHDAVPAHLNAMDILAAPSQTLPKWKEQLGRMLLEGMAVGLPIVASDSGEIPYVAADAGRIVPEADVAAWTSALRELIEDPSLRRDLAERGLARARAVYDWPVVARQFLDYFRELCAS